MHMALSEGTCDVPKAPKHVAAPQCPALHLIVGQAGHQAWAVGAGVRQAGAPELHTRINTTGGQQGEVRVAVNTVHHVAVTT